MPLICRPLGDEMPHPIEYRAQCRACSAEAPPVTVDSRQWGEGQLGAADEARRAGWSEIRDDAGGWFMEWLCARCFGGLL